jgi:hypothetical protein
MSVKLALAIVSFIVLNLNVFSIARSFAEETEGNDLAKPNVNTFLIQLDLEKQKLAGIETSTVKETVYHSEYIAYGSVLTIQPLIDLRHRYHLTRTEQDSAHAQFSNSQQHIERQKYLYNHGVASKKSLQERQLQLSVDRASMDAARNQQQAIIDNAKLLWGDKLADWALSNRTGHLNDFISGQKSLLKVILPIDKHLPEAINTIHISSSGDRSKATEATLISIAPQTDDSAQGESYFFQTDHRSIRPGMRIVAWIPELTNLQSGILIPKSAIIWHLDQSFVYTKTDQQIFSRRKISHLIEAPNDYVLTDEIKKGEQIVTTGGQLLLSEEFRVQIPDDDND